MRTIIVLALLGTALAVPRNVQKIMGGTPTQIETYPFMSDMQYYFYSAVWSHSCGGALLTASTILSGAACYYGDSPSYWRVRLGSPYTSSGGSVHYVSSISMHPQYNHNTLVNDVAIVRLTAPVQYSQKVEPCRIAGPTYVLPDNTNVVNLGWGYIYDEVLPEQLQEVTVRTVNLQTCAQRYAALAAQPGVSTYAVTNSMLCTGILDVGGSDSCTGDAGGPIIHDKDIVIGVVSWGHECGHPLYPAVNTLVGYHADWISANGVGN